MRQTPYYVFDTDEFSKRAAMIRAALDCKGGRRIPLCFSIKANPFLLHRLREAGEHHLLRRDEGKMRYRASCFIRRRDTDM